MPTKIVSKTPLVYFWRETYEIFVVRENTISQDDPVE
jgi:hypothetical protein